MTTTDMCRVCLEGGGGIKLLAINQHRDVYEKLTNAKISEAEARLCYICFSQLQKCSRFAKMAARSHQYLKTILETDKKVKSNTVSNMLSLVKLQTLTINKLKHLSLTGFHSEMVHNNEDDQIIDKGNFVDENNINLIGNETTQVTDVKENESKELTEMEEFQTFEDNEDLSEVKDCIIITKMFYECGECSTILETQEDLSLHQRTHKNKSNPKEIKSISADMKADKVITKMFYECGGCSKILQSQEDLAIHQNSHSDPNSFHHHLLSKSDIKESIRETASNKLKAVNCSICNKYFNDTAQLYTHFRMHTGQRPFICDMCGKTFRTRCHLKAHVSIHTMEKVYCKICNKGFTQSSSLGRHMLLHTGEKPFFCHICGRRCKQSGQLRMHIRTVHEGIKLHECDVCNKRFSVNSELQRHMSCHSGLKPFECEDCGIKVTTRTVLRRHKTSYCKKAC